MFFGLLVLVLATANGTYNCLNNYVYRKLHEKVRCSQQNGICYVQGAISPIINGTLNDWRIEIKFKGKAKQLWTFMTEVQNLQEYAQRPSFVLTAKPHNPVINSFFILEYIVSFPDQEDRELECIHFCGKLDSGEKLCEEDKTIDQFKQLID